tara:strand:+ start:485 stop:940 length:456 start_codon:yes stop_codon:yes gene_type:complete
MSFDSLRDKYIKDAMNTNEQPANILDQLPSYNSYETNVFIDTLNVEYQEQLSLNKLLKDENVEGQSQKVKEFVKNNSEKINQELSSLEEITNDLKKLCNENKKLELETAEYEELVKSEECSELAEKMRKIKSLKSEILHFLDGAGLRVQKF